MYAEPHNCLLAPPLIFKVSIRYSLVPPVQVGHATYMYACMGAAILPQAQSSSSPDKTPGCLEAQGQETRVGPKD